MNTSVVLFFVSNVIAALLLGMKFMKRRDPVLKFFGIGLLLDAGAFALWTIGYVNPDSLLSFVTYGAIVFLASLIFFLHASLQPVSSSTRSLLTTVGAVALLGIFYTGNTSANSAFISPEGFLFFNLTPLVQMLYLFALAFSCFPLIELVAARFRGKYAMLLRYGLIVQVVGGIMLITNQDANVLYLTGWIIGIVYFALWATLLFDKKAWASVG